MLRVTDLKQSRSNQKAQERLLQDDTDRIPMCLNTLERGRCEWNDNYYLQGRQKAEQGRKRNIMLYDSAVTTIKILM